MRLNLPLRTKPEPPFVEESLQNVGVTCAGPIALESPLLKSLFEFRTQALTLSAPWLLQSQFLGLESQHDVRSRHFYSHVNGATAAYVRLTEAPWELELLHPEFQNIGSQFNNYTEISRLSVAQCASPRSVIAIKQLLYYSGIWEFRNTTAQGLIAICRPDKLPFFRRFGFQTALKNPVELSSRQGQPYHLIHAKFETIFQSIEALKKFDQRAKTRIQFQMKKGS